MNRRHDIDALRALAFALLILYHLAMVYVADWGYHIKSSYLSEGLQLPMLFVNRWRMDLIFLISGLAVNFLLRENSLAAFVAQRTKRLLLPLAFGILVIVPIQPYCQGVSNGLVEPGFVSFLGDYYSGANWRPGAFDGWQYGWTWNHLWYLAYLWLYSAILVGLMPLFRSKPGLRFLQAFRAMRGLHLLIVPALPLCFFTIVLGPRFPDTHDLIHDWYLHSVYFTAFLYGYWLGTDEGLWAEIARLRKIALSSALALFAVYITLLMALPDELGFWPQAGIWVLRNLYIWTALLAILGWSHMLLNRPFRWLPWATEAVYPWYILHQSLIVAIAYFLIPMKLGTTLEPLLVLSGTVAGCWAVFGIVRRIRWLRPCFGMKPQPVGAFRLRINAGYDSTPAIDR